MVQLLNSTASNLELQIQRDSKHEREAKGHDRQLEPAGPGLEMPAPLEHLGPLGTAQTVSVPLNLISGGLLLRPRLPAAVAGSSAEPTHKWPNPDSVLWLGRLLSVHRTRRDLLATMRVRRLFHLQAHSLARAPGWPRGM